MIENPIAARLEELSNERGESRREVALGSGVAYHRVNNVYRRPEAKLNAEDLQKLATYLETTGEWLSHGGPRPMKSDVLRQEAGRQLDLLEPEEIRTLLAGIKLVTAGRR